MEFLLRLHLGVRGFVSIDGLAKAEDAFKVGDHLDVKLTEINEKGQLRLSHRALLPDASQEKSSVKQRAGTPMQENVPPQNSLDKGTTKKAATTTKDSLAQQVVEQHDKGDSKKVTSSGMEVPSAQDKIHDKAQSQDKVFKRVPSRDGPYINKEKQKKSSSKAVTGATSKDEGILVNGETKIGK